MSWFRPAARPAAMPVVPPQPQGVVEEATVEAEAELPPKGCGWYDSSHELSHGLTVREDVSTAELPLANWLEMHLAGWRAAPQSS